MVPGDGLAVTERRQLRVNAIWLIVPPWLVAVIVTLIGRWGERYFARLSGGRPTSHGWVDLVGILLTCLLFLALLPLTVLSLFGPLLPFSGAQSGLALAIVVVLFGLVPVRLIEASKTGWDYAFWALFIDFLRVGGALTVMGWLLHR